MITYKASYKQKCRGVFYEVGQTYSEKSIKIYERGIHSCRRMVDVLRFYDCNKDFVLLEVELLGQTNEDKWTLVADQLKIRRIVPKEEYIEFKLDLRGNLIYSKFSDIDESWRDYDDNNNLISYKHISGKEEYYEFDSNSRIIHFRDNTGYEYEKKFDDLGHCCYFRNSLGSKYVKN